MPAKQTCTLPSGTHCMCQPEDMEECPEKRTLPPMQDTPAPVPQYERGDLS